MILDTVFLGFSIACFTARQPKHICKKCLHIPHSTTQHAAPSFFRARPITSLTHHGKNRWLSGDRGHLERSLGRAPCDLDRHMPLPTSRSQGWSRGHIPLPQASDFRFQLDQDDQVGPGDLELARYSFKSKGYTAKHRIVQENDDQALEGVKSSAELAMGVYIYIYID